MGVGMVCGKAVGNKYLGLDLDGWTLTVGWSDQPMLSLSVARKAAGSGWQLFQAGLGGRGVMTGRSADRCADTAWPRYPV